ncbi:MAG TPA: prepilin-type N-terminal cleavage/methylation domain-containing protein [Fimbriiglobus sp.]|nr:prepilin-type N-terminal cleavage/methylation domain-containing protein [Fimbriiglobus sp.]
MIARPASRRLAARTRAGFTLIEVLVVVSIIVILASVATFAAVSYLSGAKIDQATLQATNIQKAATAYFVKSGVWPDSLQQLVMRDPNSGAGPLLEGGESALLDPWQNPFQFEVMPDQTGTERFVVFTQSPEGQRIQWPRQ